MAAPQASSAGVEIPSGPPQGVYRWLPGAWVLRHYQLQWLPKDLVAGVVLASLLVPVGMGYAEASGLPAVTGLYATIVPLLVYAVVGPSRIMVLGPDSALAALVAVVTLSAAGDPSRAVGLASMLALLTGVLCAAAGFARVGFITDLLSKPVRVGYINGIALTVLVAQLPTLLGFSVKASGLVAGSAAVVAGVADGQWGYASLAIGVGCLVVIGVLAAAAPKVPGVFIAVVLATTAVASLGLSNEVGTVGAVPRGLPLPTLPACELADLGSLAIAALGIALVSLADTSVLSRSFAGRRGDQVDPNRELIALGLTNMASGLFQGFPVSSSSTRTAVAHSAGSSSQLTGVVGAVSVIALLVAAPMLLTDLPLSALAAVVISAAVRLFDFRAWLVFLRVRRSDFVVSTVAFLGVALLGVLPGIGLAVGVSLLDVVRRAWRPHHAILGRAPSLKGYHDVTRYPMARQVPGLVIFRWDAPLFFANADTFHQRVLAAVEEGASIQSVVVAAEPITDVDTTAAEMLGELNQALAARGVTLAFAELKDPVKDRLGRYGLQKQLGPDAFSPTLGVAVKAYLARTHVAWVDWEEAGTEELARPPE